MMPLKFIATSRWPLVRPSARQPVTGDGGHHDSHLHHHRAGRASLLLLFFLSRRSWLPDSTSTAVVSSCVLLCPPGSANTRTWTVLGNQCPGWSPSGCRRQRARWLCGTEDVHIDA